MNKKRQSLIDSFDKWLDITVNRKLINNQCAAISERHGVEEVISELYYIAEQGNFEFKAMGFVVASRIKELTGSNKLSKQD